MTILVKQDIIPREPIGLIDGEHVLLKCSGCDEVLADLWSVKPDESETNSFRAECALCGDHSYIVKTRGKMAVGTAEKAKVMLCDIKQRQIDGESVTILHTISIPE